MTTVPIDPESVSQQSAFLKSLGTDGERAGGPGFKETLADYINDVNGLQKEADRALMGMATGKVDNIHEVLIAMGEADVSFRLMMEIRNKLLEAYREIMRMQV